MTGPLAAIARALLAMSVVLVALAVPAPSGADAGQTGTPEIARSATVGAPPEMGPPASRPATPAPALPVLQPPEEPEGEWAGPSVVRRQDAPDRYSRQPYHPYRRLRLAATGDLLIHTPVRTRAALPGGAFDFAPQLAAAGPDLAAADLAICHLEVPLDPDGPYSSYPTFNAPAELAAGIAATGWDVCSTASNHSADQGFGGLVSTLEALEAAGVEHRGMARTAAEAAEVRLLSVAGVHVGLVSATYGLNGLPQPGGHPWAVQLIEPAALLGQVRALRAAGADVVVLSLHWGEEYQHQPSAFQRRVADQLMAGGEVDVIVGHHAHVVQPVEWIGGRPVIYGLGNFLSGQRPTERRDGAIVTVELVDGPDGWRTESVHAQPTWVDDGYAVATADPDQGGVLGASARRTLGNLGVHLSPPPPPPRVVATHYLR